MILLLEKVIFCLASATDSLQSYTTHICPQNLHIWKQTMNDLLPHLQSTHWDLINPTSFHDAIGKGRVDWEVGGLGEQQRRLEEDGKEKQSSNSRKTKAAHVTEEAIKGDNTGNKETRTTRTEIQVTELV